MTASVLRFPERGPFSIKVEIDRESGAWLVLAKSHGWLHDTRSAALAEAEEIARGFGIAVVEAAHV